MEKRKPIKFTATDAEKAELKVRANGRPLSSWLREIGLGQKRPRQPIGVDPELIRQLAGLGNNLNQVARKLNSQHEPITIIETQAVLVSIERHLAALREEYRVSND